MNAKILQRLANLKHTFLVEVPMGCGSSPVVVPMDSNEAAQVLGLNENSTDEEIDAALKESLHGVVLSDGKKAYFAASACNYAEGYEVLDTFDGSDLSSTVAERNDWDVS